MAAKIRRPALIPATGAAVLLMIAGCGGSSDDSSTPPVEANPLTAYTDCLRQQGIEVPDMPTGRSPGQRPSGQPRPGGSARPTDRPSGWPSGMPSSRPSGQPGGRGPGGTMFRPEGVDEAAWAKAQQACQSVMPTGRPGVPGGRDPGQSAIAAYRNCLADRDVELTADLDTTDPVTAAALKACEALRPTDLVTASPK